MALARCPRCQSKAGFVQQSIEVRREVASKLFLAFLPAEVCKACGEQLVDVARLHDFEAHVAQRLLDAGIVTGDAFRFLRKTLRMHASDLAELLDVAPETVSRWETEKRAMTRSACAVLGALVRDAQAGRTSTMDLLRRLKDPSPLEQRITIELERR